MEIGDVYSLITDKIEGWIRAGIALLPNVVVALLLLLVFVVLARVGRRAVARLSDAVTDNRQIRRLLASITYIGILALGVFVALSVLELTGVVTSLLAGVGIVGLALGFAFQDLAANFMSGIMMALRRPFRGGDVVETNDYMGVIEEVTFRSTRMRTFQGHGVRIPNKEVFGNPIVNYSDLGRRRVDVPCGIAYGDDLEHVRRVSEEAISKLDFVDPDRGVEVFFREFGDSSINFDARFWIRFSEQREFFHARSEAIIALKRAFDENGITIPFPIRTLDFGGDVVGGDSLRDHLPAGGGAE